MSETLGAHTDLPRELSPENPEEAKVHSPTPKAPKEPASPASLRRKVPTTARNPAEPTRRSDSASTLHWDASSVGSSAASTHRDRLKQQIEECHEKEVNRAGPVINVLVVC